VIRSDGTTLEWFGTATFRIRTRGLALFFDAYLDRLPGLDPVGLSTADVTDADFVFVSHAHFDHICGVDKVALQTGATVVASPESARILRLCGVPEGQLLIVTGGETVDCGHGVQVRILPALHSCLFAASNSDSGVACIGDEHLSAQARAGKVAELFGMMGRVPPPAGPVLSEMMERSSVHDGGQLAFFLTNGAGSILVSGSAGFWRGIYADLRPDVALLSLAGRPNVDGEPYQGSGAQFVSEQVRLLRTRSVALCHHDPLFPGLPGVDIGAAAAILREEARSVDYFELRYADPIPLLTGGP
jgi:L-ascorbate metabolism protein UlaG (beta-lactamase superfamily)